MKSEIVILLLLGCISCGVNACNHGDIRIAGVSSDTILAGRVDLCYSESASTSEWRTICQHNWDRNDAMVVCREFGFPPEGAQFCMNSCLGRNDSFKGLNNFGCSGSESRTVDCKPSPSLLSRCGQTIGVICYNSASSIFDVFDPSSLLPATELETTTTVPTTFSLEPSTTAPCQNTIQDTDSSPGISAKVDGSATTEATLGGVVVILLIILVGVVIGWVWTCHRNKETKSSSIAYTAPPSSSSSFPLHSVSYKPQGPTNMPRNNTSKTSPEKMHVPESGQGIYEVPEEGNYEVLKESSDAEEDVYHELENTREGRQDEVPRHTKGEDVSKELSVYSTLQHN